MKSVIDKGPLKEVACADKGPVVDGGGGEDASLPVSLSTGPPDAVSRHDLRPIFDAVDLNEVIIEFGVVDIGGEEELGDRSNIFFLEDGCTP